MRSGSVGLMLPIRSTRHRATACVVGPIRRGARYFCYGSVRSQTLPDTDGVIDRGLPAPYNSEVAFDEEVQHGEWMSRVEIRDDESLEKALRRFKRLIEREGILKALKAKKHYEKPSERRRREMRQSISRRARSSSS